MKISLITATYNSASTIRDTLQCIQEQDYADIEHIVVDGGSADDTLRIVAEFPHIAKVISEKDEGIYDAMNKGIAAATARWRCVDRSEGGAMDEHCDRQTCPSSARMGIPTAARP